MAAGDLKEITTTTKRKLFISDLTFSYARDGSMVATVKGTKDIYENDVLIASHPLNASMSSDQILALDVVGVANIPDRILRIARRIAKLESAELVE